MIDPGQGLPLFDGEELVEMIEGASVYAVNDYEWSLTLEKTGLDEADVAEAGRHRHDHAGREGIDPAPRRGPAGDSGRHGGEGRRSHGLRRCLSRRHSLRPAAGLPLEIWARLGSLIGLIMVEKQGTQSLELDLDAFRERFEREFGDRF